MEILQLLENQAMVKKQKELLQGQWPPSVVPCNFLLLPNIQWQQGTVPAQLFGYIEVSCPNSQFLQKIIHLFRLIIPSLFISSSILHTYFQFLRQLNGRLQNTQ
jgi:hypothetical protein